MIDRSIPYGDVYVRYKVRYSTVSEWKQIR
jgi:hypothetical protein